jgi:hypothetical protein
MQADLERFLARLYTEPELRREFLGDAIRVARRCGLSASEAEQMSLMPARELAAAAASYERKRAQKMNRSAPPLRVRIRDFVARLGRG